MAMATRDRRRFRLFGAFRACLHGASDSLGSPPPAARPYRKDKRHAITVLPLSSTSSELEEPELGLSNFGPRTSGELVDEKAPPSPPADHCPAGCSVDISSLQGDTTLLATMLSTQPLHDLSILNTLDTLKSQFATHQFEDLARFAARGDAPPSAVVSVESARWLKPASPTRPHTRDDGDTAPPSSAFHPPRDADPDFLHLPEAFPVMFAAPVTACKAPSPSAAPPRRPRRPAGAVSDRAAAAKSRCVGATTQLSRGIDELAPGDNEADAGSVESQLDDVLMFGEGVLMGKYRLEPERRAGRHHVVHFAASIRGVAAERSGRHALKFYKDARHFDREMQLYGDPRFRPALAPVLEIVRNEDGRVRDPFGRSMPPFVVTECGVRLDEWARGQSPRKVASALVQVAGAIVKLHAAGLVHGALRPSCILWMPHSRTWQVTDYGTTVPAGHRACMAVSSPCIVYDAPELVRGRLGQRYSYTARRALDAWAFGLIAFELLTGSEVFTQEKANNMRVIRAMSGRGKLPWEPEAGGCSAARERVAQLGFMRDGVLGLLSRDAKHRPRLQTVRESWRRTLLLDRFAAPGPVTGRA